ncbi:hypothetical protein D3C71_1114960 [compost metagenome]
MNNPIFESRVGRELQVFIPQHQNSFARRMQHQQRFFKARDKTREILKVAAVLFVSVDNQRIKPKLAHIAQHFCFTLKQGFVTQNYRRNAVPDGRLGNRREGDHRQYSMSFDVYKESNQIGWSCNKKIPALRPGFRNQNAVAVTAGWTADPPLPFQLSAAADAHASCPVSTPARTRRR